MADPADVVRGYLAAFRTGDPETIASFVSDEFVNEHLSALGERGTGRAEYLRRLPEFLSAFADRRYEVDGLVVGQATSGRPAPGRVAQVVVRYRFTATHDGHGIEIPGVMWFVVADGLITRRTDVWDSLTFLRQTDRA